MSILVIGNTTIDYSYKVPRFPGPGETILAYDRLTSPGGKGLNQAVIAARAGASVIFYSALGKNSDNKIITSLLDKEKNVQTKFSKYEGITDESIIYLSNENAENSIVSTNKMARSIKSENINMIIRKMSPDDILLLQGNLLERTTLHCIEIAKKHRLRVIVNLAPSSYTCEEFWEKIDYLVVNESESKFLSGIQNPKKAANYFKQRGIKNIIITLGKNGALILGEESKVIKIPSPNVSVVDTTGAGDVFTGVFSSGISESLSLKTACIWASKSAGISVGRRGTIDSFPTSKEIANAKKL